jgi:hypothetical protein
MAKHNRIIMAIVIAAILSFFASASRAQKNSGMTYDGTMEYYFPRLSTAPPLYPGQPSDIASAYLWLDELMRTTQEQPIANYINSLGYGDTLKFLAKMLYRVEDDNPISFWQWSGINPWRVVKTLGYKSNADQARIVLQNHIGATFPDTGRTGFLLACDLIADITVNDTIVKSYAPGHGIEHMVLVNSTLNDEIKGKHIPGCPMMLAKHVGSTPLSNNYVIPASPTIDTAISGQCFRLEYSPEWQSGIFSDDAGPASFLSDSSGWWVKPGREYIAFLWLSGLGDDSTNQYFTVWPFWGVFGTQGAMYRIIGGHVVDPNDDFGLGGTNLTVADWKARLRARIYNILNP